MQFSWFIILYLKQWYLLVSPRDFIYFQTWVFAIWRYIQHQIRPNFLECQLIKLWFLWPSHRLKMISTTHFKLDLYPNSSLAFIRYQIHHVMPIARVYLTLSRQSSLSFIAFGKFSRRHPVSLPSCCSISSSRSSNTCLFLWRGRRENVIYEFAPTSPAESRMYCSSDLNGFRDGWLYSCSFVECCFQDFFNMYCRVIVRLPSTFSPIPLVSIHVVPPYSGMDMITAWKMKSDLPPKIKLFYIPF